MPIGIPWVAKNLMGTGMSAIWFFHGRYLIFDVFLLPKTCRLKFPTCPRLVFVVGLKEGVKEKILNPVFGLMLGQK